jgi:hypothetical protein
MLSSQAANANGCSRAHTQKDCGALPSIPETSTAQKLHGCFVPVIRKRAIYGEHQMLDEILERECAMRDRLLDLQQEDTLVDAALQALGKRVAAFQLNCGASTYTKGLASNPRPGVRRVSVCAVGGLRS